MDEKTPKVDILDNKILFELDKNSRLPITVLARRLKLSREVVKYRIKRLQSYGVITNFNTIVNPSKLGLVIYKVYLKFQNLSKEKEQQLLAYCLEHKHIFWIAQCDGSYDLMFGVYVHSIMEFHDILMDFMGHFSAFILTRHISNSVYVDINRRNYLTHASSDIVTWGGAPSREEIDPSLKSILKLIAEDSRTSVVDMALQLNLSTKTIITKIKEMESKKIILGYRIALNLNTIKKQYFKAIITFQNITPKREITFKEYCKQHPNICYYIKTIAEWDCELDIEIDNFEKFNTLLRELKEQFPDIIRTIDTVFIAKEMKGELNIVQNL